MSKAFSIVGKMEINILVRVELVNLLNVDSKTTCRVEFPRTMLAFIMLRLLMLHKHYKRVGLIVNKSLA